MEYARDAAPYDAERQREAAPAFTPREATPYDVERDVASAPARGAPYDGEREAGVPRAA